MLLKGPPQCRQQLHRQFEKTKNSLSGPKAHINNTSSRHMSMHLLVVVKTEAAFVIAGL